MRPDRFQNKVAIFTGAASGIGAATARALAAEGAKLRRTHPDAIRPAIRRKHGEAAN